MDVRLARLRAAEVIAGVGAVLLLAFLFALTWFGTRGPISPTAALLGAERSYNGWDGLSGWRWIAILAALAGLALVYFQTARRGPAVPVCLSVVVVVLSLLAVLALIYRILIHTPGPGLLIDQKAGAYLGLASALTMLYGGYRSLRQEGILPEDAPAEIPTVRLASAASDGV